MSMEIRLNTHGPGKLQTLAMISDEAGFNVVSTLIFGEKDAVLIDCQWTRSNAYRVIAEICERNLNLKAVFATNYKLAERKNEVRLQRKWVFFIAVVEVQIHGIDIVG